MSSALSLSAERTSLTMDSSEDCNSKDVASVRDLMPQLYHELHQLAERYMEPSRQGYHTLQPTAVVHEVFLRMSHYSPDQLFASKRHFYAAAAESMRQFLIEYQRRRTAAKRGGQALRLSIPLEMVEDRRKQDVDIVELDEALGMLAAVDPAKAELVKLRFFCGLSIAEAAEQLEISTATADRWWAFCKAFLAMKMGHGQE